MSVTVKNTKLSKKQKIAQEILDDLDAEITKMHKQDIIFPSIPDLHKMISDKKVSYGLEARYPTLREYMRNVIGCCFIFKLKGMNIEVSGITEFVEKYNSDLLDIYIVKRSRRCVYTSWYNHTYIKLYLKERTDN